MADYGASDTNLTTFLIDNDPLVQVTLAQTQPHFWGRPPIPIPDILPPNAMMPEKEGVQGIRVGQFAHMPDISSALQHALISYTGGICGMLHLSRSSPRSRM